MKRTLEKLFFFGAVCFNLGVFAALFGGNVELSAGGESSALSSGRSDPILLALNVTMALATFLFAYPKSPKILFLLGKLKYILAAYLLAFVSILWSTDRGSTFRTAVYLSMYLVAAAYFALRFEGDEIIRLMGGFMTILGLMSIPAQYILPPDPYQLDAWKGVFLHKNELGVAMAIGIAALTANKRPWTVIRLASLLTCSTILYLSHSMTSILAAVVAVTVILYLRLQRQLSVVFLTLLIGCALGLAIAQPSLPNVLSSATGRDATMTGRTAIWGLVAIRIQERPILGYGYGAFWSTEAASVNGFLNGFKPGQAHNGYLEVCLDLGILGLAICCLIVAGGTIRAFRLRRRYSDSTGDWMLIVIAILLIHNVAESDLMLNHIMWFIFMISSFSCWLAEDRLIFESIQEETTPCDESVVAA